MKRGGTNWDSRVPCSTRLFCSLVPIPPLIFFSLSFFAPSLPGLTTKTARLCCRLDPQNKSHLAEESVEIEPAERQEKIPTESQKEKEWESNCKGNESLLQLGKKLLQAGGTWRKKKRRACVKRWQLTEEGGAIIPLRPGKEDMAMGCLGHHWRRRSQSTAIRTTTTIWILRLLTVVSETTLI